MVIETDNGLLKFLYAFKSEQRVQNLGFTTGTGDIVARKILRIDPESIETFVDPGEIIDRVRALKSDKSIETYQPIIERFILE